MPVDIVSTSVAANALSDNVLAGRLFEYTPGNAVLDFYATGSATGLRLQISIGGVVMAEEIVVNAQNRVPVIPDDFVTQEGATGGSRISARFRNTTAGALTGILTMKISPVG